MLGPIVTTPHGKLMLTVLGRLAEFERSLIMTRTQAGTTRRGVLQADGAGPEVAALDCAALCSRRAREFEVGEATV